MIVEIHVLSIANAVSSSMSSFINSAVDQCKFQAKKNEARIFNLSINRTKIRAAKLIPL